jgi:hypothetical protein
MAQRKSPQLKKQDSYEKDHRTQMENPHAFRKNWPKKKAREHRRDRVALRKALATSEPEELTAGSVKRLRIRQKSVKSLVTNLRANIRVKQERIARIRARLQVASP